MTGFLHLEDNRCLDSAGIVTLHRTEKTLLNWEHIFQSVYAGGLRYQMKYIFRLDRLVEQKVNIKSFVGNRGFCFRKKGVIYSN